MCQTEMKPSLAATLNLVLKKFSDLTENRGHDSSRAMINRFKKKFIYLKNMDESSIVAVTVCVIDV